MRSEFQTARIFHCGHGITEDTTIANACIVPLRSSFIHSTDNKNSCISAIQPSTRSLSNSPPSVQVRIHLGVGATFPTRLTISSSLSVPYKTLVTFACGFFHYAYGRSEVCCYELLPCAPCQRYRSFRHWQGEKRYIFARCNSDRRS